MAVKTRVNVRAWSETTPGGTEYFIDGNKILGVGATIPLANLADFTRGDLIVGGATQWQDLAIGGISGSVLTRDANDPKWSTGALSFGGAYTLTIPATGATVLRDAATSLTAGRIPFVSDGNTIADDAALLWDNTNKTLGIGGAPSTTKVYALSSGTAATAPGISVYPRVLWQPSSGPGTVYPTALNVLNTYDSTYSPSGGYGICGYFYAVNANSGTINFALQDIGYDNQGSGTVAAVTGIQMRAPLNGGGGTIALYQFIRIANPTASNITTVYGLKSEIASGTGRWNLYISGTATNYAAGNLLLGTTTDGMTAAGSIAIAKDLAHRGSYIGFYNTTPITKPAATGSRGGNAALASLLTALANLGLITDSTSA